MSKKLFVFIFIFSFYNVFGNTSLSDIIDLQDARNQLQKLIEFNDNNDLRGESYKNNYLFIYTPGQVFDPLNPPDSEWLFEAPEDAMPTGAFYGGLLNTWNGKLTYQHYVVVINLRSAIQSLLREKQPQAVSPNWFKRPSEEILKLNPRSDLIFYEVQANEFFSSFKKSPVESVFAPNSNKLWTFAVILNDIQPDPYGYNEGAYSVESRVVIHSYYSTGESQEFKDKRALFKEFYDQKYGSIKGIPEIGQRIRAFIEFFYNNEITTLPCGGQSELLSSAQAVDFFEPRCSLANHENEKLFLFKSARVIDYLDYLHDENPSVFDLNQSIDIIETVVDDFLIQNNPSLDFYLYVREFWENNSQYHDPAQTSALPIYLYVNAFYDINLLNYQDAINQLKINIKIVDNYKSTAALGPIGAFYDIVQRVKVENAWKVMNKIFSDFSGTGYTQSERESALVALMGIGNIADILWNKYLFEGLGIPLVGITDQEASINLSNFIVTARPDPTFSPIGEIEQPADFKHHLLVYDFGPSFIPAKWIDDPYKLKNIKSVNCTPSSNNSVFNITVDFCSQYQLIEHYSPYGSNYSIGPCIGNQSTFTIENAGFFDIVHPVSIDHPETYENYGWQNAHVENTFQSKPVALFYIPYKQKRNEIDKLYEGLNITFNIIGTITSFKAYQTAGNATWKLINGIFFANNVAGLAISASSPATFKQTIKDAIGHVDPSTSDEIANTIYNIHTVLLAAEGVTSLYQLSQIKFPVSEQAKAAAYARALEENIKATQLPSPTNPWNAIGDQDGLYRFRFQIEQQISARGGVASIEEFYKAYYAIDNGAYLASGELKRLIHLSRFNGRYANISSKLNSFGEDVAVLIKDLDANPNLTTWFQATTAVGIERRLDIWRALKDFSILRKDIVWLEKIENLVAEGVVLTKNGNIVNLSRVGSTGSYTFGRIVNNQIEILHDGAYGAVILSKDNTITIWGRFANAVPDYTIPYGTHYFRWLKTTKVGKNPGGIDLLSIEQSAWSWAKNHAWMKAAIDRGSIIKSCTPFTELNMYRNGVDITEGLTATGAEFAVIRKLGFGVDANGFVKPISQCSPESWWDDVYNYAQNNPWESGLPNMLDDLDVSTYQHYKDFADPPVLPTSGWPNTFGNTFGN